MSSHKNAPLTPKGREAMVRCVETGLSNARRRAVQHHAEDGAPNGSNGRTICATFWPRLHRCPRAAAWPSADAGSRTPAHISSSVIAFEEASLLMPVYRWVASRSRMTAAGSLGQLQEQLQGRPTTALRSVVIRAFLEPPPNSCRKRTLADSRPDAPQQCEKCSRGSGEALAAPAELCVISGTLPLCSALACRQQTDQRFSLGLQN